MNNIEKKVYDLVKDKIANLGYRLVSVSYQRENHENYLRIVIDKDDNISMDNIVQISDLISPMLDVHDIIDEKYVLDISSLGAEKEISPKEIKKYLNKHLNIHLSHPYKGMNNIIGTLKKLDDNIVTIIYQDKSRYKEALIERKYIDKVNLAIKI